MSEAEERLKRALKLVEEQSEDEALWFNAVTIPEAYLQQALRELHAVIEGQEMDDEYTDS